MYLIDSMVDCLGLPKGGAWVSPAHRDIALKLIIGQRHVNTCEEMMGIVEKIQTISKERITKVTQQDLINSYGFSAQLL